MNCLPRCHIILDGEPRGTAPLTSIPVAPGIHTVIFQHPEYGRKARAVTVISGKTATVAVRLP